MHVDFRNKHLVELYQDGKSKKYKLQHEILQKFYMRIQELEAARGIYDIMQKMSLKYEKMQGYGNRYSIRIQDKWRLEMEIEWENEEMTVGNIYVVELSNHYNR